jgi:hypothetical protein
MTHLHSPHHSHAVQQRAPAFPAHAHLVNAPVSPLDFRSTALTPIHRNERSGDSPLVVDGEVITSITSITTTIPTHTQDHTYATTELAIEPKCNLLRRAIDDPYWILMTLTAVIGLSIIAAVIYGAIQIILTVDAWLHANAPTLGTIGVAIALIILVMICGGAKAAKCAGIHCGGCRR